MTRQLDTIDVPSAADPADPAGSTRRHFIRGVASAGASTVAAAAMLQVAGVADLLGDTALAASGPAGPFAAFNAVAPSSADVFEVPPGYRADVLLSWGDAFTDDKGTALQFGFNNDYIAYFPLKGSKEGLLFVNHEYPSPFFQHGNIAAATKTAAQIAIEQDSVGNSVVHIKQDADGLWQVVSPSFYNRRITGHSTPCEFTGPLKGRTVDGLVIGDTAHGSIANCSGGITPWGTALSCEENFQDYSGLGWTNAQALAADPTNAEYDITTHAKYGWVVETDPFDPSWTPRKHTALGRFRHENTAFRHVAGKPFVLYMGDDKVDAAVYKFVSSCEYVPGANANNRRILEDGKLYVAYFDHGRRVFANAGDSVPTSPTSGVGHWREVLESELVDTNVKIAAAVGSEEWLAHYATNRPEDLEVDTDGTVYIAFTNNSNVKDSHGAIRKLVENGNDPTKVGPANGFTWADYAGGGDRGADKPAGERGFSSCDNLTFDSQGNLWVVTDISSGSLAGGASPKAEYAYHLNNAVFMIPRSGPNAGIAFRFANMPIESEGTGPYFTPDESTLFIDVQHPGEESTAARGAIYGQPQTYTSYWPDGNKTTGVNPSLPRPSLVAVTRVAPSDPNPPAPVIPAPVAGAGAAAPAVVGAPAASAPSSAPAGPAAGPAPAASAPAESRGKPVVTIADLPGRRTHAKAIAGGVPFALRTSTAVTATFTLTAQLPAAGGGRPKTVTLAKAKRRLAAGESELALRLSTSAKLRLRRLNGANVPAKLTVVAVDGAGNRTTRTAALKLV